MISLVLAIFMGASQFDTCRARVFAWAEINHTAFSKDDLSQYVQYAHQKKCDLDFDSLPHLVSLRKAIDSIKAAEWKKNDTTVNWDRWLSSNGSSFQKDEIEELHFRWKSGAKSHEFYHLIKNLKEEKNRRAELLKRKSFAHLAISIANSDSLKFIHINPNCQMNINDTDATRWADCAERPSFLGIFYDSIHTLRRRSDIRKISQHLIAYLISTDSFIIAESRKPKDNTIAGYGFGCGWNYVAALAVFYADTKYIIEFDETNQNMEHTSGDLFVREHYSREFYEKLLKLFKTKKKKPTGCRSD